MIYSEIVWVSYMIEYLSQTSQSRWTETNKTEITVTSVLFVSVHLVWVIILFHFQMYFPFYHSIRIQILIIYITTSLSKDPSPARTSINGKTRSIHTVLQYYLILCIPRASPCHDERQQSCRVNGLQKIEGFYSLQQS